MDAAEARLYGPTADGYAGEPVAAAGDVDGDGRDDLLVSVNAALPARAWLVLGPIAGDADLADAAITELAGGAEDGLGWAMAGGDLDGDGFSDLILGAPRNDVVAADAGAVYAIFGPPPAGRVDVVEAAAKTWLGAASGGAGMSVAVGDLGADGTIDVPIGAPYTAQSGGAAYAAFWRP